MIEAKGLVKRFGDRTVVDGISFSVEAGHLYALLGGNGAGKTTTMNMLLGLLPVDGGEAVIDGSRVAPTRRPRAAFVPEVVDLYADLDPVETMELFLAVSGSTAGDPAAALSRAGLDPAHHRRRLRNFSKGMRQKVALAIAEAQGAKAIFLDEPTSGLDPTAAEQLIARLVEMKSAGAAILMSTHDVLQVEAAADRVGFVRDGKLVQELDVASLTEPIVDTYRRVMA